MIRKALFILFVALISNFQVFSHPFNATHYLIIDTDGGIDDYRTLCLLLSAPDIRVLAITASSGVLPAENVAIKVRALLDNLNHQGVPVAINTSMKEKGMGCGPALDFLWGDEEKAAESEFVSIDVLAEYFENHLNKNITFVNMGSLSTIVHLSGNFTTFSQKITSILWSNDTSLPYSGFNYSIDTNLIYQIDKLPVPLKIIQGEGNYSKELFSEVSEIWSETAIQFAASFNPITSKSPFAMRSYDEMVAVYLHFPDFFTADSTNEIIRLSYNGQENPSNLMKEILNEYNLQVYQIMQEIPVDKGFYQDDIQKFSNEIIRNHGMTEWVSAVNTFELHRHIGIYALIGAKMGIRALEYFDAGIDELEVLSYASFNPPLSCMNDGIQVSTGATLGHGLIKIVEGQQQPYAEFTYLGKTIGIRLMPFYQKQIAEEIGLLVQKYGLESDAYWMEVRSNALNYWLGFDRHKIFEIEVLN